MRAARLVVLVVPLVGCGTARSTMAYRDAVATLVAAKAPAITACYNRVLATAPTAAGAVAANFVFEPGTGKLSSLKLDSAHTTASPEVGACVVSNLSDVSISPPDRKRGEASWTWTFSARPPAS